MVSLVQQTREFQAKKWEQDELERSEWAERMLAAKTDKKGEDEESDAEESDAEDEADSSDEDDIKEGKDKVEQRSSEVRKNPNLKRSRSSDDEDAPMKPKKKKKPSSNKEKTWVWTRICTFLPHLTPLNRFSKQFLLETVVLNYLI